MGLLWALIIGLVIGVLAKALMPGRDPGGFVITMLLGVAGSFVALLIGRAMGMYSAGNDGPGIIASVLGAVVLLALYRTVIGRRHPS